MISVLNIDLSFNPYNVFDFGLTGVFLFLDSIVYWFVALLFSLYVAVAGVAIPSDIYSQITTNFEVVIGVFALFYLAYSLLKALVNPDELQKTTPKVVMNLIISLVLLGVVPIIFNYSMKLQNLIISQNVIGNLIYGTNTTTDIEGAGYALAFTTLEAFLKIDDNKVGTNVFDQNNNAVTWSQLRESIIVDKKLKNITAIPHWVEPIHNGDYNCYYYPIISTICGGLLAYVVLSFCLDMGVRVFKLAFYQIISPIPILLRILPEKKSVFDNWVKATINTWLEVFIRIFIIQIGIFMISSVCKAIDNGDILFNTTGASINAFIKVIIILGFVTFLKQAPKLLCDALGIKGEGIKLGIGGKVSASLGAAAAIGGGALSGIRGFTYGSRGIIQNARNFFANPSFGGAARLLGSVPGGLIGGAAYGISGAMSGAARSGYRGRNAQNVNDMRTAVTEGMQAVERTRERRENYRASHGGTLHGAIGGHINDFGRSVASAIGIDSGLEAMKRQSKLINDVSASRKAMADAAEAEINKNINKYEATNAVNGYRNLSVVDNLIETITNRGQYIDANGIAHTGDQEVAEYLRTLKQTRSDLKDELVAEYLNGVNLDSTKEHYGSIDINNIAGPVQEAIAKYNTNLKNNIGAITSAFTAEDYAGNEALREWRDSVENYLRATRNMNITEIMGNVDYDIGKLAEAGKKFAGNAGTRINTVINSIQEREERRNNNNNNS